MLTQSHLKEILYYNPHVGVFVWCNKKRPSKYGKTAGVACKSSGYIKIAIAGKNYSAQLLVWLYVHGRFSELQIDHRDGDKTNNLLSNLREAKPSQNSMNAALSAANKSGVKGVSFCNTTKKWLAQIDSGGKVAYRKSFKNLEDAEREIKKARENLHGEFCNHGVHLHDLEEKACVD